jgi:DNA-binding NtrC family response regulator
MPQKILIVDDTPANLSVLLDLLEPHGYIVSAASDGHLALNVIPRLMPDLILLDVMMPELDGIETCRRIKADPLTAAIPILFISARDDAASIIAGFHVGAADYIVKPFRPEEVLARVQSHLRLATLTQQLKEKNAELLAANEDLQQEIARHKVTEDALSSADSKLTYLAANEAQRWGLEHFVGNSPMITAILDSIRRVQNFASVNVLITGESGTGKELVARAIHFGSARRDAPFIPINCVAIPDELAESMLFGHLKGSFTGATTDRKGYFELAHGGTLFLDEIGDMPASMQAKLLRVLEDGHVTPIGASTSRKVDVRVVAATNAHLSRQIPTGAFRRDLFFRLAQFTVQVPALRERREDVPLLAEHFMKVFAHDMGIKPPRLSARALARLASYDFPGNIRELKNIIERSLIESGGEDIQPSHLYLSDLTVSSLVPESSDHNMPRAEKAAAAEEETADTLLPLNLEKAEALLIQRALSETGGNIAKAARLLGINRTRIYRKFQEDKSAIPSASF